MSAYDTAAEYDKSYVTVDIFITFNLQPPVFQPAGVNVFRASIKDHEDKGTEVIDMNALDSDITVSCIVYGILQ